MIGKLSISILAWGLAEHKLLGVNWLEALAIGVLPIWIEVLISKILHIEPSREKNRTLLLIDSGVDAVVFLLLPALWFFLGHGPLIPTAIFVLSGILRLKKFLGKGLVDGDYFVGVPVTYMGYIWPIMALCDRVIVSWIILLLASFLMNTSLIKIKAGNYEVTKI